MPKLQKEGLDLAAHLSKSLKKIFKETVERAPADLKHLVIAEAEKGLAEAKASIAG